MDSPVQSSSSGRFTHYAASLALMIALGMAMIVQSGAGRAVCERMLGETECIDADPRVNRLLTAAAEGDAAELAAALESGIEVNASGRGSWTALARAAAKGHVGCCELLLRRGAKVDATTAFHWTPLMLAIVARQDSSAQCLIRHGADVNYRTPLGITALMVAAREADSQICNELIAAGARFDIADVTGRTVLHCAADSPRSDSSAVVRNLLALGLDPNARDDSGNTPLMEAAAAGNEAVIEILVAAGADREARDVHGRSALDLVRENNWPLSAQGVRDNYCVGFESANRC